MGEMEDICDTINNKNLKKTKKVCLFKCIHIFIDIIFIL